MATTSIHAITQTISASFAYAMSDKVEAILKDDVVDSINYAVNDKTGEVTYYTLSSTLWCRNQQSPAESFHALINAFGSHEALHGNSRAKDEKPILAWHLIQSFDGKVDPRVANKVGRKLAEEIFKDHPVVISTHTNTENTHNHIVACAWNFDGKKFHYCHDAYRKIRNTSDRLCDEYGLSVSEHTREQKLVQWKDSEGNVHYYEPTDRKNELIRKRKEGKAAPDDIASYRNSILYEISEAKKESNVTTVKAAIDSCLPYARSFDHLLFMLREEGFRIKAKKKDGGWLAHIVYIPPTSEKGVRDSSIDKEGGFYTRENLTAVIEKQNAEREESLALQDDLQLPHYDAYEYGKIDVQSINEDYRADIAEDGSVRVVRRGEPERDIIRDAKLADRWVSGLIDTTVLDRLVEEQKAAEKRREPPHNREEILIRQIREGFENLKFIEERQLYSYEQITNTVKELHLRYNSCSAEISRAEQMIDKLVMVTKIPAMLAAVRQRMEQGKDNPVYMMEDYHKDVALIKNYTDTAKRHNLSDAQSYTELNATIQKYRSRVAELKVSLDVFASDLGKYNRCVAVLDRIDRERNGKIGIYEREPRREERTTFCGNDSRQKKKRRQMEYGD